MVAYRPDGKNENELFRSTKKQQQANHSLLSLGHNGNSVEFRGKSADDITHITETGEW